MCYAKLEYVEAWSDYLELAQTEDYDAILENTTTEQPTEDYPDLIEEDG